MHSYPSLLIVTLKKQSPDIAYDGGLIQNCYGLKNVLVVRASTKI